MGMWQGGWGTSTLDGVCLLFIKDCASTTAVETFVKHLQGARLDSGEARSQTQALALSGLMILAVNMLNSKGDRDGKWGGDEGHVLG